MKAALPKYRQQRYDNSTACCWLCAFMSLAEQVLSGAANEQQCIIKFEYQPLSGPALVSVISSERYELSTNMDGSESEQIDADIPKFYVTSSQGQCYQQQPPHALPESHKQCCSARQHHQCADCACQQHGGIAFALSTV